jgi:hypothetical protein
MENKKKIDVMGVIEFMDGLYVGNTYFDLSKSSQYIQSAVFLHDTNVGGQEIIRDSLVEKCHFGTYLCLSVTYNMIYFNELELANKLFEKTGSMLIVCDRHSYACLFAGAISRVHGKEFGMDKLREVTKITSVEERIFDIISTWENK